MGVARAAEAVLVLLFEHEVVLVHLGRRVGVDHRRSVLEAAHHHRSGQRLIDAQRGGACRDPAVEQVIVLRELPVHEEAATGIRRIGEGIVHQNEVEARRRDPSRCPARRLSPMRSISPGPPW